MYAKRRRKQFFWCWLFVLPTTLFYAAFQAWPILSSIYYSTLDWSGISSKKNFVGLANFAELFKDQWFWNAFANSFKYMVFSVPPLIIISLLLALIVNEKTLRFRGAFRTLFFLPVITTASIVGIIMQFIWSPTGAINALLDLLGNTRAVNFLGQAATALPTVAFIGVWKDVGIYMIYWLAALQSVPQDVVEAAEIDGANKRQVFRFITLPIILPIGAVITLLAVINSLKVFDIVQTMTGGGPYFATDVMGTFVYRTAYESSVGMPRLGYASAAAMLFGITIIVIGVVLNALKNVISKHRVD
ncbi:sugar ABC transporter permease [Subdoligranulum sp. DSM 109015]|uniref:Sugar ABC transporter permease n=1 Tax=Gemmiger gallinarum TaxID=2779354 RepID=A0ABR9R6H6_9FIRM|nr:sugar ABC transporter permease [Gemmiger gallinarum]MBE5038763.1 sugar ABC transporter permease [Gemmiger gallinarum]